MLELTQEQQEALRKLGDPESELEVLPIQVLDELTALRLVYKRADGHLDFTEAGHAMYDRLASTGNQ